MKLVLFMLATVVALPAADWLNAGGDPQRTGWQQRGKAIQPGNVNGLKLLWKRPLDTRMLTTPVMLGPIITHRGVKELVFIGGASDDLYAVDADLGRIFWRRHIEVAPGCGDGMTSSPAMAPAKEIREDDEGTTPMRPFYFVAGDGVLHTIRPADGLDMAPPLPFVPAHSTLSALTFWNGTVYATTARSCGGTPDGIWSIQTKAGFTPAKIERNAGVAIGAHGVVYPDGVLFPWKGRDTDAAKLVHGPCATWADADGVRWIYVAERGKVSAFRVIERGGQPSLDAAWFARDLDAPLAPAIHNGIVFVLDGGDSHASLIALDAHSGKRLYSSGDTITSTVKSSGLAIANGHICFGTADNTLYCFGFPIEI